MRTKILMNWKIIEQVRDFNYLGCDISGWLNLEGWDGQGMQPEWRKLGVLSKFLQVNLQESDHLGGLGIDGRTILELTLKR